MNGGLQYIIYNIQQTHFSEEIIKLKNQQAVKSSKLQKLSPFLCETPNTSIMRVGGRLKNSDMPYYSKHPIILPPNHTFTTALVRFLHEINSHAGAQATSAFLRQRYWVINARKVVRKVVRSCIFCFKQKPVLSSQLMGDLPYYRVSGSVHAFERVGVDFAGPIMIHYNIRGKKPTKAYLAIFVCFLTKACHIEVVSDLSSSAFISALKRFFACRGLSSDIFCDNATNFVGASRQLAELSMETHPDCPTGL
mgnify:CR=1 FL=1